MNTLRDLEVAPHGFLLVAAFALLLVMVIHLLGFRALVGVRVGR